MIVTADKLASDDTEFYRVSDSCFYCAKPLKTTPLIMWDGGENQVWLHPKCSYWLAKILKEESCAVEWRQRRAA